MDALSTFTGSDNEAHMANMVTRLDFNGFYSSKVVALGHRETGFKRMQKYEKQSSEDAAA